MVYTFRHLGEFQMPWKEYKPMDERLRFIARLQEGEKNAPLAGSPAIRGSPATRSSTATRNAVWMRSTTGSRTPYRQSNRLPYQVERTVLGIKHEHPSDQFLGTAQNPLGISKFMNFLLNYRFS